VLNHLQHTNNKYLGWSFSGFFSFSHRNIHALFHKFKNILYKQLKLQHRIITQLPRDKQVTGRIYIYGLKKVLLCMYWGSQQLITNLLFSTIKQPHLSSRLVQDKQTHKTKFSSDIFLLDVSTDYQQQRPIRTSWKLWEAVVCKFGENEGVHTRNVAAPDSTVVATVGSEPLSVVGVPDGGSVVLGTGEEEIAFSVVLEKGQWPLMALHQYRPHLCSIVFLLPCAPPPLVPSVVTGKLEVE
jgi:hypothetical protein